MKFLDGQQVAAFIQVRQAASLAKLKQIYKTIPKLVIIITDDRQGQVAYAQLKAKYAAIIGAEVQVHRVVQEKVPHLLQQLDKPQTQGVMLQLPLQDPRQTDQLCNLLPPDKDVDGLNPRSTYISSAATAVDWLLASYGIDLRNKQLVILGLGKLVGQPLYDLWKNAQLAVHGMDENNLSWSRIKQADLVVAATGQPSLIHSKHLGQGGVVLDVGGQYLDGRWVGDIHPLVYEERQDLVITPKRGGVGPLTIAVLFDNLITAALKQKAIPYKS